MEFYSNLSHIAPYVLGGLVVSLAMAFGHYSKADWLAHNVQRYTWGVFWTLLAVTLIEIEFGPHSVLWTWGAFWVAGVADLGCYTWDWLRLHRARQAEREARGEE